MTPTNLKINKYIVKINSKWNIGKKNNSILDNNLVRVPPRSTLIIIKV